MMAVKVFLVVLLMIAEEKMNRKMMCSFWCTRFFNLEVGSNFRAALHLQITEWRITRVPCMILIMAISVFNNDDDDGYIKSVLFKVLFSLFF